MTSSSCEQEKSNASVSPIKAEMPSGGSHPHDLKSTVITSQRSHLQTALQRGWLQL
jgi:hypothetical protein